jgi:hypothetical protein
MKWVDNIKCPQHLLNNIRKKNVFFTNTNVDNNPAYNKILTKCLQSVNMFFPRSYFPHNILVMSLASPTKRLIFVFWDYFLTFQYSLLDANVCIYLNYYDLKKKTNLKKKLLSVVLTHLITLIRDFLLLRAYYVCR